MCIIICVFGSWLDCGLYAVFPFGNEAVGVALTELLEFFVDSLELFLVYFDGVE